MSPSTDLDINRLILERLDIPRRLSHISPRWYIAHLHEEYKQDVSREGIELPGEKIARLGKRAIPVLLRDFFVPWKNKVSACALNKLLHVCSEDERSDILSHVRNGLTHRNVTVQNSAAQLLEDWGESA